MHDIEPHYHWLELYSAAEDRQSPFYGRQYDEFSYTQKIYNYFIHPQWDEFGSSTLYMKILYVDYVQQVAIMELIGEWNDCLHNDIELLKRNIADQLIKVGIVKFIVLCEHVLNFHGSDECYYEEWMDDVIDEDGWICFVNTLDHVQTEMEGFSIQHYINLGTTFNNIHWRRMSPMALIQTIDHLLSRQTRAISY